MKYSVAIIKSLKVSPRKLSLVANLIRNIGVADALKRLTFCEKTSANEVKKCLSSAIANAENNHAMDIDNLYVARVEVGKSLVIKRFMPRAKGRSSKIEKKFSNIVIKLAERV